MSRIHFAILTLPCFLLGTAAQAQLVDDYNPPRAGCCLTGPAQQLLNGLQDFNQLGRYDKANVDLMKSPVDPKRVVFMGDSITDSWMMGTYFPGKPFVNRGISGQTTPQMLVRMFPDVINLKPAAMIVLAGTNDIARNTGPMTAKQIQDNIQAMTELAQAHGIKVLLSSVTPVSGTMLTGRPPADILKLNAWMKEYCAKVGATYVDYFSSMIDDQGLMKPGIARDGLHPNDAGYKIMAPIAAAAIDKALSN
jgi:lysophospholipase L1-like esterase